LIQSLLVTCRLHGVDSYTYLVDVLQRISEHPASHVLDLTPRLWKTKFSHNPMKSDSALAGQCRPEMAAYYQPTLPPQPRLTLTRSAYSSDYRICHE
jgi:hypothetical protein